MNRALNSLLAAGVFAAGSLVAQDGLAQHTTPFTTPPAARAPAAPAATASATSRQAVVLVAMTGDEATDAQLRATADALKQRLQARGYGDTDPARLNQALAADPAGVATLRSRLGAGCMVRVDVQAHDHSGVALLVTVQSEAGEKAVPVQSSKAEIVAKVIAAAEPLLPTAPPAPPPGPAVAPPPAATPTPVPTQVPAQPAALDRVVLVDGTVLEGYLAGFAGGNMVALRMPDSTQRTIPWNQVKQIIPHASGDQGSWNWAKESEKKEPAADWSKRGGSLLTMDVQGQIVGVLARLDHPYVINYPDGQQMTFTGDSPSGGGGAGIGFHIGFMQLEIPNPAEGSTLLAFRMGTGIDVAAVAFAYRTANINTVGQLQDGAIKVPLEQEGGETQWSSARVVMLPLFLGGQIGSGEFVGEGLWRGVMFGLDWRPTYAHTEPADLEGRGHFNYLGVAAHVDMGSLNANRDGLESNFRISVTYLPTIDRNASYASLGFGAVWY